MELCYKTEKHWPKASDPHSTGRESWEPVPQGALYTISKGYLKIPHWSQPNYLGTSASSSIFCFMSLEDPKACALLLFAAVVSDQLSAIYIYHDPLRKCFGRIL